MNNFDNLADALKKVSDPDAADFDVFIKIDGGINEENIVILTGYGINCFPGWHWARGKLSKNQIEKLSQEPGISYIELFKTMNF